MKIEHHNDYLYYCRKLKAKLSWCAWLDAGSFNPDEDEKPYFNDSDCLNEEECVEKERQKLIDAALAFLEDMGYDAKTYQRKDWEKIIEERWLEEEDDEEKPLEVSLDFHK